jgi:hypothetical protein
MGMCSPRFLTSNPILRNPSARIMVLLSRNCLAPRFKLSHPRLCDRLTPRIPTNSDGLEKFWKVRIRLWRPL